MTERMIAESKVKAAFLRLMQRNLQWPFSQICVHLSAFDILEEMCNMGFDRPPEDVQRNIAQSKDGIPLAWIEEQLKLIGE